MSEAERREGVRLIERRIKEAFSSAGKTVESIQWNVDRECQMPDYESNTIHMTVDGEELQLTDVPRQRIEAYSGGAGNQVLDARIRELLIQFASSR